MASKKLSRHVAGEIGKNIKRIREKRGFSRADLAQMMKISYQQVYKFEEGKNKVSAEQIILLKYFLGTTYNDLFKGFK